MYLLRWLPLFAALSTTASYGQTYAPEVYYTWERAPNGAYTAMPDRMHAGYLPNVIAACTAEFVFPNPVDLFLLDATIYAELETLDTVGIFPHFFRVDIDTADGILTQSDNTVLVGGPPFSSIWIDKPGRVQLQFDITARVRHYVTYGNPTVRFQISTLHPHTPMATISVPTLVLQLAPVCTWCWGDFDESGGVDMDDLFAFLEEWQQGGPCADVDRSAGVDGDDLTLFVWYWQLGRC